MGHDDVMLGHAQVDTSSARPRELIEYSEVCLDVSADLQAKADSVTDAVQVLASARNGNDFVPLLGNRTHIRDGLQDLAGDWYHLDEFVGDVGRGFARIAYPDWPGDVSSLTNSVVTGSADQIRQLGEVGFADRDEATNQAREDAAAIERALDAGDLSVEEMEELASQVGEGQYDPAYAVRLAQVLGPDAMASVPGLIEGSFNRGLLEGEELGDSGEWANEQLAPFSTVLGTALGMVDHSPSGSQYDPQDVRLDRSWATDFIEIGQESSIEAFDQSLLIRDADIPIWMLTGIAGGALADTIRSGRAPRARDSHAQAWGAENVTQESNVLDALGQNPVASFEWLDAADSDGRSNAAALVQYDLSDWQQSVYDGGAAAEGLGNAGSDVLGAGLVYDRQSGLFNDVIDAVGEEGELHMPELAPGLAEGTAAHMDHLDERINDGWQDGTPPDELGDQFDHAGVFMRELMGQDEAAQIMREASGEYLEDQLVNADGDDRDWELVKTGRVLGLIAESDVNARIDLDSDGRQYADGIDYVMGQVPVVGDLNDLADALGSGTGEYLSGVAAGDDLTDDVQMRLFQADQAMIDNVARHHFERGDWTFEEVEATAAEQAAALGYDDYDVSFVEENDEGRVTIKPTDEMSPAERSAYFAWMYSPEVAGAGSGLDVASTPSQVDYLTLVRGAESSSNALRGE